MGRLSAGVGPMWLESAETVPIVAIFRSDTARAWAEFGRHRASLGQLWANFGANFRLRPRSAKLRRRFWLKHSGANTVPRGTVRMALGRRLGAPHLLVGRRQGAAGARRPRSRCGMSRSHPMRRKSGPDCSREPSLADPVTRYAAERVGTPRRSQSRGRKHGVSSAPEP